MVIKGQWRSKASKAGVSSGFILLSEDLKNLNMRPVAYKKTKKLICSNELIMHIIVLAGL